MGLLAHGGPGVKGRSSVWRPFHRPSAVIVEMSNRDPLRKLCGVADVVAVVVRNDDVVELLLDRHVLDDVADAVGITVVVPAGAGVEQQCLSGGRHIQDGLPAFGVDHVEVERRRRSSLRRDDRAVHHLRGLCLSLNVDGRDWHQQRHHHEKQHRSAHTQPPNQACRLFIW